ncbi:hypothetical protein RV17_GL001336 [Enterococcus thailandicus]|nr:hypothetical protein [Enterococcus thailandicus]OJG93754.1 hypothetical protein RV17_GL001336 [Enterococcus thailandicus]
MYDEFINRTTRFYLEVGIWQFETQESLAHKIVECLNGGNKHGET